MGEQYDAASSGVMWKSQGAVGQLQEEEALVIDHPGRQNTISEFRSPVLCFLPSAPLVRAPSCGSLG